VLDGAFDEVGGIVVWYSSASRNGVALADEGLTGGADWASWAGGDGDGGTRDGSSEIKTATGQFVNGFSLNTYIDDEDVAPSCELPVLLAISNTGVSSITQVSIAWGGREATSPWADLDIPPGCAYADVVFVPLGDKLEDISYSAIAAFADGSAAALDGQVLTIAKPDISIGNVAVTNSGLGARDFSINLFNASGIRLAEQDGCSVRLSFFSDPMHEEPVGAMQDIVISEKEHLELIDEGGMSWGCHYAISPDDLDEDGELPHDGIWLYVKAEALDASGAPAEESGYLANHGSVHFERLWPYGQDAVVAMAGRFDGRTADVSVINRSMRDVPANSGRIVASLTDEGGGVIETQKLTVSGTLRGEGSLHYAIEFSQAGDGVRVSYSGISPDCTLGSLSFSEIPFRLGGGLAPGTDGKIHIEIANTHCVPETLVTAVANNPDAAVSINGVSFGDVGFASVPLLDLTTVSIVVSIPNGDSLAYEIAISNPAQAGVEVAGKIRSYNPKNPATIRLMQGGAEAYSTTIEPEPGFDLAEQEFVFGGVLPGTYSLVVTKDCHLPFTVQTVVVGEEDVDLTQDSRPQVRSMLLRCGDIDGDGVINDGDLTELWMATNYNKSTSKAANPRCDLDGDGMVNDGDLTILWMAYNYNRGPVVIP
jgi:hypothetical protein